MNLNWQRQLVKCAAYITCLCAAIEICATQTTRRVQKRQLNAQQTVRCDVNKYNFVHMSIKIAKYTIVWMMISTFHRNQCANEAAKTVESQTGIKPDEKKKYLQAKSEEIRNLCEYCSGKRCNSAQPNHSSCCTVWQKIRNIRLTSAIYSKQRPKKTLERQPKGKICVKPNNKSCSL